MRFETRPRGQSMVEFALILPILLILLLGLLLVGQWLLAHYTVNQAVRAAAHQAALYGGDSQAAREAAAAALNAGVGMAAERAEITVTCAQSPCRRYDAVTVQIVYRDAFWTPLLPGWETFAIHSRATRAAERDQT